jgi:hypothetical protein
MDFITKKGSMSLQQQTELCFVTYFNTDSKTISSNRGNSCAMVFETRHLDKVVDKARRKSNQKICVLCRNKVSEDFAKRYIRSLQEHAVPGKKGWFYLPKLRESIERLNEMSNHKPLLYAPLETEFRYYDIGRIDLTC